MQLIKASYIKLASLLAVMAILSACVPDKIVMPVANPIKFYQHYQGILQKQQRWQFSGLVGFRVPNKTASANISWQQRGKVFSIILSGPLGIGANKLVGNGQMVTLTNDQGKTFKANSAKRLMMQNMGWSVPVKGLIYWLKGLAVPGVPKVLKLNAFGLIDTLAQEGWLIRYSQYHYADKLILPGRIIMNQRDVHITLVINHWQFATKTR